MSSRKDSIQQCSRSFDSWISKDACVQKMVDDLDAWLDRVPDNWPFRFYEFRERLPGLVSRLEDQFRTECEVTSCLAECHPQPHPEVDATERQSCRDQKNILRRLKNLLSLVSPANHDKLTWDDAIYEFRLICDAIEQHRDQQIESFSALSPSSPPTC